MSTEPHYTLYHPRWYRRRVSVWWWLHKRSYTGFVLRELTSVFVAFFAVLSLWQLLALARGPEAYGRFLSRLGMPLFLVLDTVVFLFVLFHAITWFNLTPKAMVVRLRGKRVPDWAIVGLNYAAWLVISGAVAFVLLRRQMLERITPLLWLLFSAGGTVAALLFPIHVLLTGLAFPLGWLEPPPYEVAHRLLTHPVTRLYLFVLISLPLFHWAHRFRYTLYDGLQLKHLTVLIAVLCYGAALLGTAMTAYLLWNIQQEIERRAIDDRGS